MSRITTASLGGQGALAGLDTTAPGGRFRRKISVAIPTGGAQAARIAAGAVLDLRFASRDVAALEVGVPEPAGLSAGGNGLVLSLPVARRIRRVRLNEPVSGDKVAAFRFDGGSVAEDPVVARGHGNSGSLMNITAAELILRRRNSGDHALSSGDIDSVILRYRPVNARLLVALDGEEPQPLPPVLDPDGQPVFPAVSARGAELAEVLTAALARLPAPLPDPLMLDLVLEADEPCRAGIDTLDLTLELEQRRFAGTPGKRVLRFGGKRRESQQLDIPLPTGATITESSLSFTVSGKTGDGPAVTETNLPVAGSEGVALGSGLVVAGRLNLGQAAVAIGAVAVLAATDAPTEILATLYSAQSDGLPGAQLAESAPVTLAAARPGAVPFFFPPTVLPAGAVWVGLSAGRGTGLAMLGGSGAIAHGDGARFTPLKPAGSQGLAAALRLASDTGTEVAGLSLDLAGTALPSEGPADLTAILAALETPSATLTVSADFRGLVTLDPPLMRHTLSG